MEKDKQNKKKIKIEVLKSPFRGQLDIIRKTHEDGTRSYEKPGGRECKIDTWNEELECTLHCLWERLAMLTELVSKEDFQISILYGKIIKQIKKEIEELFEFICEDIGLIRCTWMADGLFGERRCIGAYVEPFQRKGDDLFYETDPDIVELLKQIPPNKTEPLKGILNTLKSGDDITWYPVKQAEV